MSVFRPFEAIAVWFTHRVEGVRYLTSGPYETGVEYRQMDVLGRSRASLRPRHTVHPEHKRVLKEGTARPLLPCRIRVTWPTGYLELNSADTLNSCGLFR